MEKTKQKELTKGFLLNDKGELNEAGYSTSLIKDYRRSHIKAWDMRIKEWDYYIITDSQKAIALTIADNSYMALYSASFLDFTKKTYKTTTDMSLFSKGKTGLPETSEIGEVKVANNKVKMSFLNDRKTRKLLCFIKEFDGKKSLNVDIELTEIPRDSMVIATPFPEDKAAFYYNQKINCLVASGTVQYGDETYTFDKANSLGTLDWGRGVWTYENTWYWGSLSCYVDSNKFGFNIGYGFGDTSKASENMLFWNGIAHKLDWVTINIPKTKDNKEDYMSQWSISSNDGRFEMVFNPVIDRFDDTNALVISSCQHQVFGYFFGKVVLDNGDVISIENKLGFVEKVVNKW